MSDATSDAEREKLEALGYTEAWIEAGLLPRDLLAAQYERLESGGTKKTGKYRGEALAAWLGAEGPVDDAQLDACLAVAGADPDAKMAQAAVAELIRSPRLGLPQLEKIARADPKLVRKHEALIRRTYLERRLAAEVNDELIEQVIESRDAAIQTRLVRDERLSRKHAEAIAKRGVNPQIRSNAEAWIKDKKAWK